MRRERNWSLLHKSQQLTFTHLFSKVFSNSLRCERGFFHLLCSIWAFHLIPTHISLWISNVKRCFFLLKVSFDFTPIRWAVVLQSKKFSHNPAPTFRNDLLAPCSMQYQVDWEKNLIQPWHFRSWWAHYFTVHRSLFLSMSSHALLRISRIPW